MGEVRVCDLSHDLWLTIAPRLLFPFRQSPWSLRHVSLGSLRKRLGVDVAHFFFSFFRPHRFVLRTSENERVKPLWPYFSNPNDVDRLRRGLPIEVNSCWNGVSIINAKWFYESSSQDSLPPKPTSISSALERRGTIPDIDLSQPIPQHALPLKFRRSERCYASECLLISYDLHRGLAPLRPKIFLNTKVLVGEFTLREDSTLRRYSFPRERADELNLSSF